MALKEHPRNMDSNSLPLKTITYFSNYFGDACAHLRLFGPSHYLDIHLIAGKEENGNVYPDQVGQADLVVLQRDFPREFETYEAIVQLARQKGIAIVFDIDDLLFMLPEDHPDRLIHHYTPALLPIFEALHEVDAITVTTPELQEILSPYHPHIFVLPNYFDDSLWKLRAPATQRPDGPLVIGYMGSESHQPDLEFLAPALEKILANNPGKVLIQFWGVKPAGNLAVHPQVRWIPAQTYRYQDFAEYFQTQTCDIFIAPLRDNVFNSTKSPLKFFEYSALGIPGVYSRIAPFERVIVHEQNGLLAATQDEWVENIERLIHNPELRRQLAAGAQETIRRDWLLSEHTHVWREAYATILARKQAGMASPDEAILHSMNRQYLALLKQKSHEFAQKEQQLAELAQQLAQLAGESAQKSLDMIQRDLELSQKNQTIVQKDQELMVKDELLQYINFELSEIKISKAWKAAVMMRETRVVLVPPNSAREQYARKVFDWLQRRRAQFLRPKMTPIRSGVDEIIRVPAIPEGQLGSRKESIDVIVCVHNALEDVRNCLQSVVKYTSDPFTLIIVDDGSDELTREYLASFAAQEPRCRLIRNDAAKGYTLAANMGMRASQSPHLVLLNSDTIVGPEWIERMYRAMVHDPKIGVVGPLANTASWQSIPNLSENGDWASNFLPAEIPPARMSQCIAQYSGCIFPEVPLLNGFCLMIRKEALNAIGYFDEENFGQGYGEEDDFNLRASTAGWKKVIADDVYIYHAQSKSYSHSRRYTLSKISGERLRNKHGAGKIAESVAFMNPNRVMEGIRGRASVVVEREEILEQGRTQFAGKGLLFILPVIDAGGGANVIIDEARCIQKMGVNVSIFNLTKYKPGFLESYPHIDVPLMFGDAKDLVELSSSFDAVVASANYSVKWLKPLEGKKVTLGYYVQGFEPLMYPDDSASAREALATYTMIENFRRFTKTEWTRQMVYQHTGADSDVVGISVNIDLCRPRDTVPMGTRPVKIAAMIRPSSPYRNPILTISLLKKVKEKYGDSVQIWLFGAADVREIVSPQLLNFPWMQLGKLTQLQVASMMSKADIFTDFSSHQAMGLSALEAMAAGCSVIVPQNGGATEFVRDRGNGMVVDTTNYQASLRALEELVEDDALRLNLQMTGMRDVVQYYPEKAALKILETLFRGS